MRTNVVLNEELLAAAARLSGNRSKRAILEEALKLYVRVKTEERRRESWRERAAKLDAKLSGLRLGTSPRDVLRESRERAGERATASE